MNIIYVVTSGEYSDYAIDAVFDNYEAAHQATIDAGYECWIEEYQLNKQPEDNWVVWKVWYCKDTDTWDVHHVESWLKGFSEDEIRQETMKDRYNSPNKTYYTTFVRADNRDAALKIANEKIMMAIAKGKL